MTSQENHQAQKAQFGMQIDPESGRMVLDIPLDTVAMDPSSQGIIFMLGFFENAKNEAVAIVRKKRMQIAASKAKIIVPGGAPLGVVQ